MQVVAATSPLPFSNEGWGDTPTIAPSRSPLERPIAALKRYKWLALGIVVLATLGGLVSTRFLKPDYEVRATIWIASMAPSNNGPIRDRELLNPGAWTELLNSFKIADAVVRELALYVRPKDLSDSTLFRGFDLANRAAWGTYKLAVEKKTAKWTLTIDEYPTLTESGNPGDSIGRKAGFRWAPTAKLMSTFAGDNVTFTVSTPRETSVALMKRLVKKLPDKSNFLWLTFTDPDAYMAARTLNAWINEYVKVAEDMKKSNMVEFTKLLEGQLAISEASLHDAETALETFRVQTISLPGEGVAIPGGLQVTQTPAIQNFFNLKIDYENLKHDRTTLEKVIAANGTLPYESVLLLPTVANSPGGKELQNSLGKLYSDQAQLTTARQTFTDEWPAVRGLAESVNLMKNKTIPELVAAQLSQIKEREMEVERRISSASVDLESIPTRTIEEMRLRRAVAVQEGLYGTLKQRYAESQLASSSSAKDVNILDSAVAPLEPTKKTAPRIMLVAFLGGLGAAVGIALLLDGVDKRIRYPEQATNDLGLSISGTVPLLPKGGIQSQSAEQLTQLVESFRTLRMNVMHSSNSSVSIAVSSPSPGDGKSFIASNLAMSFADAGFRTLLVDADTRRGTLHEMFELPRSPGLTDFLAGQAEENTIVHPTGHDKLMLIPTGHPRRQSPELLITAKLPKLVADMRARFDVVIFDTPPLAAGIDGYAIAAATGNLLVVLRIGQTERRMAAAKLLLVDRLPINVMGAVLNAAPSSGEYEYYGYVGGYAATDGLESGKQVAQIS